VLGILDELSEFTKRDVMIGFLEKVVLPLKTEDVVLLPIVMVDAEAEAPFAPMTIPPVLDALLPIKILPDVWLDANVKLSVTPIVLIVFDNIPPAKVCTKDQMLDTYKRIFKNQLFTHAVVATLVVLFVLAKMVEVIRGCEVNVVTPFIVFVAVPAPIAKVPPDKLVPSVIAEVRVVGCIVFTYIVDVLTVDALIDVISVLREFVTYPFTHAVVGTLEELSEFDKDAFMIGFVKKVAVDTFNTDVFVVPACKIIKVPVEAFRTDVFVFETNRLFINVLTHAVVGTLEELSVLDKDEFMIGLYKKVALDTFRTDVFVVVACKVGMVPEVACKLIKEPVDTFRTDVFVVVACTVPIVPVVDWNVGMVPEVACKLIKEPVDTFRTEVFVVVACIVLIVPAVDCKVGMVPEVACKLIKEPVDTFRTEVFVVVDCTVPIVPVVD